MDLDPIVVEVKQPKTPFKLPFKMPQFGNKSTKIITIAAVVVIVLSIIVFTIFTILINNDSYRKKKNIVTTTDEIRNSTGQVMGAAIAGNNEVMGKGGGNGPDKPDVTISASRGVTQVGTKVTLKWKVSSNAKTCTASQDWSGQKPLEGSEDSPSLSAPGIYSFLLTCKNDTSTGYSHVEVTAQEQQTSSGVAGVPVISITTAEPTAYVGGYFTVIWDVSNNPTSCTASGDWSGKKSAKGSEKIGPITRAGDYNFKLDCVNTVNPNGPPSSKSIPAKGVSLPPDVPVVTIDINPAGPIDVGSSATITWSATNNPGSCDATGDWSGTKSASGSQSTGALSTAKTYNYKLSCTNGGGTIFDIVSITAVQPPPTISSFTASPSSLYTGSSSTLNWAIANNTNATCSASGSWSGAKTANASNSASTGALNTAGTYTYGLTCTNSYGSSPTKTATVTASVQPVPSVVLIADSYGVTANNGTSIHWSSTNSPSSCTASGSWSGAKSTTGTTGTNSQATGNLAAGSYTYTLNCTNSGGTGTASITVVASTGSAGAPPAVTLTVSPGQIGTGGTATINWSITNATGASCTASGTGGWSGAQPTSGSTPTNAMNTTGTYTFILSCTNAAGSGSNSAQLIVSPLPVVSLSLSATTAEAGSSVTITWSSTNTTGATPCTASGAWSGAKAASGSATITAPNPASPTASSPTGTSNYVLTCTGTGGSGANNVTLTSAYCFQNGAVRTSCYGPTTMNAHATAATCWNFWTNTVSPIYTKVYNMQGFNSIHSGKSQVTLNTVALCGNKSLNWALPNFPSNSKHSSVISNNSQSTLNGYAMGYYDPNSPN